MKYSGKRTRGPGWLILGLLAFCACDSKYNVIEAFLQNGAETKLFTYTTSDNSNLGQAVAISGNVALVGRYLYRWDGVAAWTKDTNLPRGNIFKPVALSGMRAVVGDNYSVTVYRFNFNGTPPSAAYFGAAVAVEQNVALIGAPFDIDARSFSNVATAPGRAYVYRWDGTVWREQKILTASDGASDNSFGAAVSLSGRLAIVGALYHNAGAAYVYVLD